ncbi:MAG: hypothetical protein K1X95_10385 [Acidimicrobiia bacterium]|nr:hypothetical protein [Acidimicrobiia bacterium]
MAKKKKRARKPRTARPGGDEYKPRKQLRRQRILVMVVVIALVVALGVGAVVPLLVN